MERKDVDLNKPAFGPGSEEETKPEAEAVEAVAETEEVKKEEVESDDSVEEQKVPYSRFKKYHELAKEAQTELEEARARLRELESRRQYEPEVKNNEPDQAWLTMYGDSEASRQAFQLDAQRRDEFRRELRQEALDTVRAERQQEEVRSKQNLETLDTHIEHVSAVAGRDLTEKEESAVLDIIDEYTPKDDNGNYAGSLISPDKAWEIYELKQNAAKAPRQQSRNAVASLTGTNTQGETDMKAEENKNFNPLNWGAWRSKV